MSLDQDQIRMLKMKFGPLFALSVGDRRFVCRTITRSEAALIGVIDDDNITPEKMSMVFDISVLDPAEAADDQTIDAGTVSMVVDAVLEKSGLSNLNGLQTQLMAARNRKTVYHDVSAIICAAFPSIIPGELDSLSIDKLMDLVIIAENTLIIKGIANNGLMQPVDFLEEKEEEEETVEHGTVRIDDDELARTLFEGAQRAAEQYLDND